MRKVMLILLIICCSGLSLLLAQSDGTGANFLKIGVGPRAIGLGSAFAGVGDDVYTLYWNPAGIGFIRRWELSAMYNKYFADMYYGALTGVKQYRIWGSRKTAFGFGLFYHGMPDWDSTERADEPKASASNMLGMISLGQRMDWISDDLSIGINAKFGQSKLMEHSAWMLATDIGIMYRFDLFNNDLTFGAAVQHLGIQTKFVEKKSPLPYGFRTGISYRLLRCSLHNLLFTTEIAKYKGGDFKLGFGAEYWLRNLIGIHGGYNMNKDDLGDISFGASVRLDPAIDGLQFDYSSADFGNVLGNTQNGALTIHAVSPEPFRLLEPADGSIFCPYNDITLKWEAAEDPDHCDEIRYRVLVDYEKQNVEDNVNLLVKDHLKTASTLIDTISAKPQIHLPALDKATLYYWTALAFDKAGHSYNPKEIRKFKLDAPDIIISELRFVPSDTLPALNDDYQGRILVKLTNESTCSAPGFKVLVTGFFACDQDPENRSRPLDTLFVPEIQGGARINLLLNWHTRNEGIHSFHAIADFENTVDEKDETNNENDCEAVTIPRGKIWANTDSLKTNKITFEFCNEPLLPLVFFNKASAKVDSQFYEQIACEPLANLKIIAERLAENPDITVEIFGYVDPESEAGMNPSLGHERAQNVLDILVNQMGVPSNQVQIAPDYDPFDKRIPAASNYMADEENRRVELHIKNPAADAERRIFGSEERYLNDALRDGLIFNSQLASFSGCAAWQLVIKDGTKRNMIKTLPFNLSRYNTIQRDSLVWVGNDQSEQLVAINSGYSYTMNVQDKLGRWFESKPQTFFISADSLIRQERHVFLMKFNKNTAIYQFYDDDMKTIANRFIDDIEAGMKEDTTYKIIVLSSTCPVGTIGANYELITKRKRSHDKFIMLVEDIQKDKYNENYSEDKHFNPIIARIDTSKARYNIPAKNIEKLKGGYVVPLYYYSPCCCYHDIRYGTETPGGRNFDRRIEIVLYKGQEIKKEKRPVVDKR